MKAFGVMANVCPLAYVSVHAQSLQTMPFNRTGKSTRELQNTYCTSFICCFGFDPTPAATGDVNLRGDDS